MRIPNQMHFRIVYEKCRDYVHINQLLTQAPHVVTTTQIVPDFLLTTASHFRLESVAGNRFGSHFEFPMVKYWQMDVSKSTSGVHVHLALHTHFMSDFLLITASHVRSNSAFWNRSYSEITETLYTVGFPSEYAMSNIKISLRACVLNCN